MNSPSKLSVRSDYEEGVQVNQVIKFLQVHDPIYCACCNTLMGFYQRSKSTYSCCQNLCNTSASVGAMEPTSTIDDVEQKKAILGKPIASNGVSVDMVDHKNIGLGNPDRSSRIDMDTVEKKPDVRLLNSSCGIPMDRIDKKPNLDTVNASNRIDNMVEKKPDVQILRSSFKAFVDQVDKKPNLDKMNASNSVGNMVEKKPDVQILRSSFKASMDQTDKKPELDKITQEKIKVERNPDLDKPNSFNQFSCNNKLGLSNSISSAATDIDEKKPVFAEPVSVSHQSEYAFEEKFSSNDSVLPKVETPVKKTGGDKAASGVNPFLIQKPKGSRALMEPSSVTRSRQTAARKAQKTWMDCRFSPSFVAGAKVQINFKWEGGLEYSISADADVEKMDKLDQLVKAVVETGQRLKEAPEVGWVVLAPYGPDHYRARVISVNGPDCHVEFLDYGDFLKTGKWETFILAPDEIIMEPIYGLHIVLEGVSVPEGHKARLPRDLRHEIDEYGLSLELCEKLVPSEKIKYKAKLWVNGEDLGERITEATLHSIAKKGSGKTLKKA